MKDAYEFLSKGGVLMIPILLCSVLAVTIFLERLWVLQKQRVLPKRFIALIREHLHAGRFEAARAMCDGSESPISAVFRSALNHMGKGRSIIKEAIEETGRREVAYMERFVGALGSIANIAPLLGLLGTVTGMIKVFQDVVAQVDELGEVNAGGLAAGIWEALITTAAGLSVAIPVFIMFKYLTARIDRYVVEMEDIALSLIDPIAEAVHASPKATPDMAHSAPVSSKIGLTSAEDRGESGGFSPPPEKRAAPPYADHKQDGPGESAEQGPDKVAGKREKNGSQPGGPK